MSTVTALTRIKLTGICPAARGAVAAELVRTQPAPVWVAVADDLKTAEQLAEDTAFFFAAAPTGGGGTRPPGALANRGAPPVTADFRALVFPESMPDSRDMREAFAASSDRLNVLSLLRGGHGPATLFIATTPAALLQPVPARAEFAARELTLTKGMHQPFTRLLEELQKLDYDSEAVCESPGSYAVRGGIVDVYPVTATQPYRLDFFGDDLEDIRGFDPVTQRSGESVATIRLAASPRVRLEPAQTGVADYLPAGTQLILVEPVAVEEAFAAMQTDGAAGLAPLLQACTRVWGLADLDEASPVFDAGAEEATWDTESLAHHRRYAGEGLVAQERLQVEEESRNEFLAQVKGWSQAGYEVIFVAAKEGEEQRMREILAEDPSLRGLEARFLRGGINEGFRCATAERGAPDALQDSASSGAPARLTWLRPRSRGLVLVTETEVFGRQRARRAAGPARALVQRAQVDQLLDFSELVEGDFVVHLQHGIALFRGLSKLDTAAGPQGSHLAGIRRRGDPPRSADRSPT